MELQVPTLDQVAAMLGEKTRRAADPMPGSNGLLRGFRNIEESRAKTPRPLAGRHE